MKTLVLVIGFAFVLVSLPATWVSAPVSKDISGLRLSVLGESTATKGQPVGAYAFLAVITLVVTFVARRQAMDRLLCWMGVTLLLLALTVPMQLAFGIPDRLRVLALENDSYRNMQQFSNVYLPLNRGVEPTYWASLDLASVAGRLISGWYFLGLGWYLFVAGGLIVFAGGLWQLSRTRLRLITIAQAMAAGATVALLYLVSPLRAQLDINRALILRAHGQLQDAIAHFRNAMDEDDWWRLGPEVPRQIGELHDLTGTRDTGEYRLFHGYQLERNGQTDDAVYEYKQAVLFPGLRKVGLREAARLSVDEGLRFYRQGVIGSAITAWQDAVQNDPHQLQALYYTARAQYDLASYADAITANRDLLHRTSNQIVLANLHSNLGDCYQKLGDYPKAHAEYDLSNTLDKTQNFRSLIGLVGH